jgi:hypothetical protein
MFELALARVSRQVEVMAKRAAAELRAERLRLRPAIACDAARVDPNRAS